MTTGRLLSVNVGRPQEIEWDGKTVRTAIWKDSVDGPRMVRLINIDGDDQADRLAHGGEHRAVFVYQIDSYRYWERELGSGGNPSSHSVIRSWPPVNGVLDVRWLEVDVTSRAAGGTLLHAESQSQWVITRPPGETIPAGVREVDVTSSWPGKAPFLSRRVMDRAKIRTLVALFDSLGIVRDGSIQARGLHALHHGGRGSCPICMRVR